MKLRTLLTLLALLVTARGADTNSIGTNAPVRAKVPPRQIVMADPYAARIKTLSEEEAKLGIKMKKVDQMIAAKKQAKQNFAVESQLKEDTGIRWMQLHQEIVKLKADRLSDQLDKPKKLK